MTTATHTKRIVFDRITKDWAAYLNGEYIGSFGTHAAAEAALDQVAYDLLADGVALTAAELDGGSDADTMAEEVVAAVVAPAFICAACKTSEYSPSAMQPGFCFECVHAMLKGRANRLECASTPRCECGWADTCECQDSPDRRTTSDDVIIAVLAQALPVTTTDLVVAEGSGWRVQFDRSADAFLAVVDGVGCVGREARPLDAQRRCRAYVARHGMQAAA